jgi:hypothetical protein
MNSAGARDHHIHPRFFLSDARRGSTGTRPDLAGEPIVDPHRPWLT